MIRLANNNLVDTKGLYKMALDVVEYPEDIAWLDLSFNDITKVSNEGIAAAVYRIPMLLLKCRSATTSSSFPPSR